LYNANVDNHGAAPYLFALLPTVPVVVAALPEAGAAVATESAAEIVVPGGQLIGSPGIQAGVRTLGLNEMMDTFSQLANVGQPTSSDYPGIGYDLPGNGFVGLRMSIEFGPTVDINILGLSEIDKFHLELP
jgi:hypothetical protein